MTDKDLKSKLGGLFSGMDDLFSDGVDLPEEPVSGPLAEKPAAAKQLPPATLTDNEIYLKTVMDVVPSGILVIDAETRKIVDANPAALKMIGLGREAVIGSVCHRFVCPAEQGNCPVCDLGQTVDNSNRILLTTHGDRLPIMKNVVTVTLNGRLHLVESFISIAEQVKVEEQLRESEARYRQLFEETRQNLMEIEMLYAVSRPFLGVKPLSDFLREVVESIVDFLQVDRVVLITFDLEERKINDFVAGGPGVENVVETSFEELWSGLSGWVLREQKIAISPKGSPDPREDPEVQKRRVETNCGSIIVLPLVHQNKTLGTLTVIDRPEEADFSSHDVDVITTIANQTAMVVENARLFDQSRQEVAQRRRIEDELVKFKLGIERSSDAIFITDVEGKFIYVNDSFEKIYEYTQAEVLGQDRRILRSDVTPSGVYDEVWRTLLEKKTITGEVTNKAKSGRLIVVEHSNNPIVDDNDNLIGFLTIHHDITKRRETAEVLAKRAVELETVAQVGVATSTILETDKLLCEVVDLVKERFDLYHAHIYLFDEAAKALKLAAGAGKVGRQMVAHGWTIPLDQEQSLVARTARDRRGIIVNNVRSAPDWLPNPLLPDTRAEMAVPLVVGSRLLGVLDMQSDQANYFTEEDVRIQTTLAAQVAVALQNTYLFEETEKTLAEANTLVKEQTVLAELGQALTARLDVQQVLEEAYRQTSKLLDTTNFYIGLYDQARHEIRFAFEVTESEIDKQIMGISVEQGLCGYIIRTGEPLLIEGDVSKWQNEHGISPVGEPTKSWLGVPLIFGGQKLGVIAIISFTTPGLYNSHSRDLLTAVASQVATAIYNASQFERVASAQKEAEARLMETQALQRLSQSLAGELEAGKIMNIFFKACTQVIGFEYVEFFMIDQQRQWIKTVAGVGVSAQKLQDKGHSLHSNDITADIIRSGKTEVLTGWDERLDRAIFEAEGHANWVRVFVPVKLRQETIGLVEAGYNKSAHSVIDDRQVQLLHTFIDQTVISLENAQRYEARQKDVIREQTIREITEKLRSATNLKELARATAEELGTRLSAGHVVVKLGTELQGNETAVETVKGPDYV